MLPGSPSGLTVNSTVQDLQLEYFHQQRLIVPLRNRNWKIYCNNGQLYRSGSRTGRTSPTTANCAVQEQQLANRRTLRLQAFIFQTLLQTYRPFSPTKNLPLPTFLPAHVYINIADNGSLLRQKKTTSSNIQRLMKKRRKLKKTGN